MWEILLTIIIALIIFMINPLNSVNLSSPTKIDTKTQSEVNKELNQTEQQVNKAKQIEQQEINAEQQ